MPKTHNGTIERLVTISNSLGGADGERALELSVILRNVDAARPPTDGDISALRKAASKVKSAAAREAILAEIADRETAHGADIETVEEIFDNACSVVGIDRSAALLKAVGKIVGDEFYQIDQAAKKAGV